MKYDIVVIGAGLGGLECGYTLSRLGMSVCVLEQGAQAGGCLQTFRRAGTTFDTGFHYVGGLGKDQALGTLMRYYDLGELPWQKLDDQGFDEVIMADNSYLFPTGHKAFEQRFCDYFPHEARGIKEYAKLLATVGGNVLNRQFGEGGDLAAFYDSLFSRSAYDYLNSLFRDERIINVLSGTSQKLEPYGGLPLYTFAQTNESYIESAWRLAGGGETLVNALVGGIEKNGGKVSLRANVVELSEKEGEITAVVLSDGERIEGAKFISNIHPARTLSLIPESKAVRGSYRRRVTGLENTYGMFTVNIKLKQGTLPYPNRNIHIHTGAGDVWNYHKYEQGVKPRYILASYTVPSDESEGFAECVDLLTPMHWQEVERWSDTEVGQRGEEYKSFKEKRAQECMDIAEQYIPGLRSAADRYYTSTPLTWRDYTGTVNGSAFGIRKDCDNLAYTMLPVRTPLKNLFLTGQNPAIHGIMGVSMTALSTCAHIVGEDCIKEDFSRRTK